MKILFLFRSVSHSILLSYVTFFEHRVVNIFPSMFLEHIYIYLYIFQSHCTKSDQIRPLFEPKDHNVLFGNKRRSDVIYISLTHKTKQNKLKVTACTWWQANSNGGIQCHHCATSAATISTAASMSNSKTHHKLRHAGVIWVLYFIGHLCMIGAWFSEDWRTNTIKKQV